MSRAFGRREVARIVLCWKTMEFLFSLLLIRNKQRKKLPDFGAALQASKYIRSSSLRYTLKETGVARQDERLCFLRHRQQKSQSAQHLQKFKRQLIRKPFGAPQKKKKTKKADKEHTLCRGDKDGTDSVDGRHRRSASCAEFASSSATAATSKFPAEIA